MAKVQTKPEARVMVVAIKVGPSRNGMNITGDRRRSVPGVDGKPGYTLTFRPGVPLLISGREIDACQQDLDNGSLVRCEVSHEHLLQVLNEFADAERDRQLEQLRETVKRLTEALRQTGMYDQAAIDAVLTGRKLQTA